MTRIKHRPGSHLTDKEVEEIRSLYEDQDRTIADIAEIVGCSNTTIQVKIAQYGWNRQASYYRKYPKARRRNQNSIEYIVDQKTKTEMIEAIMDGASANQLVRDGYISGRAMLNKLLAKDENFKREYEAARILASHAFLDDLIDMSHGIVSDKSLDPNRVKISSDLKKYLAKVLNPKEYGDKQQIDHTSSDETVSTTPTINIVSVGTPTNNDETEE